MPKLVSVPMPKEFVGKTIESVLTYNNGWIFDFTDGTSYSLTEDCFLKQSLQESHKICKKSDRFVFVSFVGDDLEFASTLLLKDMSRKEVEYFMGMPTSVQSFTISPYFYTILYYRGKEKTLSVDLKDDKVYGWRVFDNKR